MSASEKKRIVVYANPKQREILDAAYRNKNDFTIEEYNVLSSETGLTVHWIKAWVVRARKAKRDRIGFQPDEPAPRRKAGRPARQSNPEPSTTISPAMDSLPHPNDSFMLARKAPTLSVSISDESAAPFSRQYYHEAQIRVPLEKRSAPHLQQYWPGERPRIQDPPTTIRPAMDSLPYPDDSFLLCRKVPTPTIPTPISDASVAFSSTHQYYHESEIHIPSKRTFTLHSQQPYPMLLPRHFIENIDPTLERVPEQLNTWGTVPAFANSSKGTTTLAPSARNTPISYTPERSRPTSGFAPTPVSLLVPRNQLFLSQPSPFCPSETPPFLGLESISSSHFRPFAPVTEHIMEHDNSETDSPTTHFEFDSPESDFPTTTAFNTPIDDQLVCSTAPLIKVDSAAFNIGKTPFRHLEVLHGQAVGMTVDEMWDRLLDEDLVVRDPFQAAMGLVFMSKTGLDWSG